MSWHLKDIILLFVMGTSAADNVKQLDYTSYLGYDQGDGVSFWKGIRFAAAPVGELRFAGPQDPPATKDIQDATASEDCLFLDVYAPTKASNLPVFVWIPGGGYNSIANANYDGTGLIKASGHNIVVVTINYRVGPYGFLASKEVQRNGSLNNGLKDIIQALEWVQKHIATFGGDPSHVTVGGDSAGGDAITLLLSSYGGSGKLTSLLHAAAVESPSLGSLATVEESKFVYDNLTIRTGCAASKDTFGCLRNLDIDTLQKENYNIPFPNASLPPIYLYRPTIDNDLVTDHTYRLFGQGKFIKIPVIFGFDSNEGTIFTPHHISTIDQADQFIQANFPTIQKVQLDKVNSMYMSEPDNPVYERTGKYWQGVSNAYGEIRYICPAIYILSAYSGDSATINSNWGYHYAVLDSDAVTSGYGTTHTIEVNAIWGPQYVSAKPPASYSTSNGEIVPLMQQYWTSFIRSYNPNTYRAAGSPKWQPWGDGYKQMFIQTGDTRMIAVSDDQKTRCKYLQSIAQDLAQ
ncbi:hypothetical protein EIK77_000791 [Talaromyces pinophilus]|nr:hypothetical protein EIK77_000791 [Talaromyces pinophilus]